LFREYETLRYDHGRDGPEKELTEHRLDAVEKKVDDGFKRIDKKVDEGFKRINKKVDDGFMAVDQRFGRLEGRFEKLEDSYYALNRTLIGGFFVMIAALIGATATLIGIAIL
jgi:hypothetical protein